MCGHLYQSSNEEALDFLDKLSNTEESLQGFIDYMHRFEEVKTDWQEWFSMAKKELLICKQKSDTLETMKDTLERIQVLLS